MQTILSDSFLEDSVENSVDISEDGDALSSLFKRGGTIYVVDGSTWKFITHWLGACPLKIYS